MKQKKLITFWGVVIVLTSVVGIACTRGLNEVFLANNDNGQEVEWVKMYGGIETDRGYSLIQTEDRGYLIAGWTNSFGAGGPDIWVIKTDANGTMLWNHTYGGTGWDYGDKLIKTTDEGFVIGGISRPSPDFNLSESYFQLLKIDRTGNELWVRIFGSGEDSVSSVVQTADGGYIITGSIEVPSSNDPYGDWSNSDVWLIKTDPDGTIVWDKTYGGKDMLDDEHASALVQTTDGGFMLVGSIRSVERYEDSDVWVVKTNADGEEEWNKTYGGEESDGANYLVPTIDGGFVLAGYTYSYHFDQNMWLVKIDAAGEVQWNKTYGEKTSGYPSYGTGHIEAFTRSSDGGFIMATSYFKKTGGDSWIIKTDEEGTSQWIETFTGDHYNQINDIIETVDGGYAFTGFSFRTDVDDQLWLVKTRVKPESMTTGLPVIPVLLGVGIITIRYRRKITQGLIRPK